ncbi:hypothetical protein LSAT2_011551 [Lamellibrachia satsuma]|nr:hypothetical protein LSAT2_011551 [Lamellibrachia satsuma]
MPVGCDELLSDRGRARSRQLSSGRKLAETCHFAELDVELNSSLLIDVKTLGINNHLALPRLEIRNKP